MTEEYEPMMRGDVAPGQTLRGVAAGFAVPFVAGDVGFDLRGATST